MKKLILVAILVLTATMLACGGGEETNRDAGANGGSEFRCVDFGGKWGRF